MLSSGMEVLSSGSRNVILWDGSVIIWRRNVIICGQMFSSGIAIQIDSI